ncbi:MAG TPA: hypothetical protein VGP02_04290, partial [Mycobacteriales bacterium]|nr:hypothetical protein [Mycobacteriales bacterium]
MHPSPTPRRARYRWLLVPRANRFPRRRSDWLPLTLVVVLVLGLGAVGWNGSWLFDRITCRDGVFPSSEVWSSAHECVGLSNGPYAFGLDRYEPVMGTIGAQNTAADTGDPCGNGAAPVTVGVLLTLTDPGVGGRGVPQLEGMAAAQAEANQRGCSRPIRLRIAQMGAAGQAAVAVAQGLVDSPDLVAVVGLGLSTRESAEAIGLLARNQIPMVAAVITAVGFDAGGLGDDPAAFAGTCADVNTYQRGFGGGFFYRVAFSNRAQIHQLHAYVEGRLHRHADLIVTPTTVEDPYTCTALPLLHQAFGAHVHEVRFNPVAEDVNPAVEQICRERGAVTVMYAARASDLSRYLIKLDELFAMGTCGPTSVTVVSPSDASRLRAPEPDGAEELRVAALRSASFATGRVRLVYTPLAAPEVLAGSGPGFQRLREAFAAAGFSAAHLDDGWAENGYDVVTTVAAAVDSLSGRVDS